ncbi:MAG: hypothetical protein AAF735_02180 [Myxococcota bacterium]
MIVIAFVCTAFIRAEPGGTVTLPLEQLLELQRETSADESPQPPTSRYVVSELSGEARIVNDALETEIAVKLSVLTDGWVSVPLLEPDEALSIVRVPTVANGFLTMNDDGLRFITEKRGDYRFSFSALRSATKVRGGWRVEITPSTATARRLRLRFNDKLYTVTSANVRRDGDALVTFADRGRWTLSWIRNRSISAPAQRVERPPVEPVVTRARSSVVLTLDGQEIARHYLDLRLDGQATLRVNIPSGQSLIKTYVNGVSRRFDPQDGSVEIEVSPTRPGEPAGILELVTKRQSESMKLAGRLRFEIPEVSWDINETAARVFLPDVFNYTWRGGSLSPHGEFEGPNYTYDIPTPGKVMDVSQQLVSGAADVVYDYTVDLEGQYHQ